MFKVERGPWRAGVRTVGLQAEGWFSDLTGIQVEK